MKDKYKVNINSIQERFKRGNKWLGRTEKSLIYTSSHDTKDKLNDECLKNCLLYTSDAADEEDRAFDKVGRALAPSLFS